MTLLIALLALSQSSGPMAYTELNAARQKGMASMTPLFSRPKDAEMVKKMAQEEGDLRQWQMHVLPALKGWGTEGELWLALSTDQELQLNHNLLFRLESTPSGWKIGPEITELEPQGANLIQDSLGVDLRDMAANKVRITSLQHLKDKPGTRASYWKINPTYKLTGLKAGEGRNPWNTTIAPEGYIEPPQKGQAVQAGGFIFVGDSEAHEWLHFTFEAEFDESAGDRLDEGGAYLTSYWFPHLSRITRPTRTTILAPKGMKALGEGELVSLKETKTFDEYTYECKLPVTWSKAVVDNYQEVGIREVSGVKLRTWQLPPVDKKRSTADLDLMERALKQYSQYGRFPFKSYVCADANGYYGIESYSFTLIEAKGTTGAVSHELGHTWFGGMAPCRYIDDSWCEGVTQYVDSVRLLGDRDGTLISGFQTMRNNVPLDEMANCWSFGSASYTRGAYVLHMLEAVIGKDAMTEALRVIAATRDPLLDWHRLRGIFEKASKQNLQWFWDQWVTSATWPTLKIDAVSGDEVSVVQRGTPKPYRLRFRILGGDKPVEVTLDQSSNTFTVPGLSGKNPKLEVFRYTLAKT